MSICRIKPKTTVEHFECQKVVGLCLHIKLLSSKVIGERDLMTYITLEV